MSYLQAILLGIVQGLTEFLPVSSSGHLVVLEHFLGHKSDEPAMILFDLALHLGTTIAILVYYRHSVKKYLVHLAGSLKAANHPVKLYHQSASIRFSILALAAIAVNAGFFKIFGGHIKAGFASPSTVAICWIITATLLILTDRRRHTRRSLRQFGLPIAALVGLAQGVAMLPGISRSGATICVAILFGLHRRWAGEFSFLIGVPVILGATLLEGIDMYLTSGSDGFAWGPMTAGTAVSTFVGLGALSLLIWAVRRAKLKYFAFYCYLIAVVTLVRVYGL